MYEIEFDEEDEDDMMEQEDDYMMEEDDEDHAFIFSTGSGNPVESGQNDANTAKTTQKDNKAVEWATKDSIRDDH
jgi:hypothetical protein